MAKKEIAVFFMGIVFRGYKPGKVGLIYILLEKQKYFACGLKIPVFAGKVVGVMGDGLDPDCHRDGDPWFWRLFTL